MCGRTVITAGRREVMQRTRARRWRQVAGCGYRPSYNAPPSTFQPVLMREATTKAEPTPAIKAEPTPTIKTEPTTTTKAEPPPTIIKTEPTTTIKSEPAPTIKTEPTPTTKAEPAPTIKTEPTPTIKTEPTTTIKAEPTPTIKAEPTTDEDSVADELLSSDPSCDESRTIQVMRWGVIPSFTPKEQKYPQHQPSNARAEALLSSPMWRRLVRNNRCVALAEGYYEWKTAEGADGSSTKKQPFYITRRDGGLLMMAALYDCCSHHGGGGGGATRDFSYAIVTTESTGSIASIHHRMPVILESEDDVNAWLDPATPHASFMALLRPRPELLHFHAVSPAVNSVRNNSPMCIEPYDAPTAKRHAMARFFGQPMPTKGASLLAKRQQPEPSATATATSTTPSLTPVAESGDAEHDSKRIKLSST